MRWIGNSIWLVSLVAACAKPQAATPAVFSPGVVEEPVTAVLLAALDADRRMATADSLWDPEATVIGNGQLRYAPPRFAGIEPGGQVAITSSRLEVRQSLVWVYLEYRWISVADGLARDGRATVLLTPRNDGGGWKIVHLHSSTSGDGELGHGELGDRELGSESPYLPAP